MLEENGPKSRLGIRFLWGASSVSAPLRGKRRRDDDSLRLILVDLAN